MRIKNAIIGTLAAVALAAGVGATVGMSQPIMTSADALAYTITFEDSGGASDGNQISTDTTVSSLISSGNEYVSGISATSKTYFGKNGYGLKFGSGSSAGSLTLSMAESGQITATKFVVHAAKYGTDSSSFTVNGTATTTSDTLSTTISDITYTYTTPTALTSIAIVAKTTSNCRFYITAIDVYGSSDPSVSIEQGTTMTKMAGADNQTLTAATKNITTPVYSWTRESGTSASIVSGEATSSLVISIGDASETPTVFKITVGEVSASISVTVVAYGASSISWTDRPTSYNEGDVWALSGTASATMNDGSTKTLADSDVSLYVNGSTTSASRPYTITNADTKYAIGFGGSKSTSLTISLNLLVSGIAVKTAPTKTSYVYGETLDIAGGVITATYSNETTIDVDMTADMASGYDSKVLGKQTITVTYKTKTAAFDVTVTNVGTVYESSESIVPSDFGSDGYGSSLVEIANGYSLSRSNVGKVGNYIQIKSGTSYFLANSNDLGPIQSIVITAGSNGGDITVFAGSSAKPTSSLTSSASGSVYTFSPEGAHYFKISNSGSTVTMSSIEITIVDEAADADRAAATRDYAQKFLSCPSGWTESSGVNSRAGVAGLAAEYNALNTATKNSFAALEETVSDYDADDNTQYNGGSYVEGGTPSVANVNILVKLKMIVAKYNSTLTGSETKLTLKVPGGDYTGVAAGFIESIGGTDTLSITIAALFGVVLFAVSGLYFGFRRKHRA